MKRPDIYATLGYTTDKPEVVSAMIKAGIAGARINSAYCSLDEYIERITTVREQAIAHGVEIPIMMDIKGPQLRLMTADPGQGYAIEPGIVFPLGFYEGSPEDFVPDSAHDIYVNHNIKESIKEGDTILIENGSIVTRVLENNGDVHVQVVSVGEGIIKNNMGVNIPGKYLNLPHLTQKDKEVIDFSLQNDVEEIALSFVRDQEDMKFLIGYIARRMQELDVKKRPALYAKVEDRSGIKNLYGIIQEGKRWGKGNFGLMIARGDMFNEISYMKLSYAQEVITKACHDNGVKVQIGTGLLESMKYNTRPTRAEIGDVWNALRDNPDSLMLSAETSNSEHPVLAVRTLSSLIDDYTTYHQPKKD